MMKVNSITKKMQKFCIVDDVFDNSEIAKILDLEELQTFQKALIGHNGEKAILDPKIRNADNSSIAFDKNSQWIYERMADLIPKVNYDFFLHSLSYMEPLQYLIYNETQHYEWHMDQFYDQIMDMERKISFSIILSNPEEYEGGGLRLAVGGNFNKAVLLKPKQGSIVFFDSIFPHKVEPVTSGARKTIVSWVSGSRHANII